MSGDSAEFTTTRVGSGAGLPVVIVPLALVAVIGIGVIGGRSPSEAVGPGAAPVAAPAVRVPTWSVPHPNEVRTKGVRLMRLARLVDPYER
jgi:hypothetical protein